MIQKIFIGIACIGFFSCGNSKVKVETDAKPFDWNAKYVDSSETELNKNFISILLGINSSNVNQFINPVKGLYIINSSGALPAVQNIKQIEGLLPVDFSEVKDEELPHINCDSKTFWSKDGCFCSEENQITASYVLDHSNFDEVEKKNAEELAGTIVFSVINTKLNTRYYFSRLDGKWYLTFIDMRKPCSA